MDPVIPCLNKPGFPWAGAIAASPTVGMVAVFEGYRRITRHVIFGACTGAISPLILSPVLSLRLSYVSTAGILPQQPSDTGRREALAGSLWARERLARSLLAGRQFSCSVFPRSSHRTCRPPGPFRPTGMQARRCASCKTNFLNACTDEGILRVQLLSDPLPLTCSRPQSYPPGHVRLALARFHCTSQACFKGSADNPAKPAKHADRRRRNEPHLWQTLQQLRCRSMQWRKHQAAQARSTPTPLAPFLVAGRIHMVCLGHRAIAGRQRLHSA